MTQQYHHNFSVGTRHGVSRFLKGSSAIFVNIHKSLNLQDLVITKKSREYEIPEAWQNKLECK
jgi:hypothetical protein